jgi:hypothetical protein
MIVNFMIRKCKCENNGDACDYCAILADIRTEFVYPPIPDRSNDWSAVIDGDEEFGPYGRGETKEAAINNLLDQLEGR